MRKLSADMVELLIRARQEVVDADRAVRVANEFPKDATGKALGNLSNTLDTLSNALATFTTIVRVAHEIVEGP